MKRVNKCIENKKEKYNANKIARIFLSSPLKLGLAIALNFIFFLIFSTFVFADGWAPSKPSHGTLYADTITSKTVGSPVNVADSLFVVEGITTLGSVGIGTAGPTQKLQLSHGNYIGIAPNANGPYVPTTLQRGNSGGIILAGTSNADGTGWAYGSRVINNDYGDGLGLSFDVLNGAWTNDVLFISGRNGKIGNVGIGTTNPDSRLHVVAGTQAGLRIGYGGSSANFYDADEHHIRRAAGTDIMTILSSGNVGIGTTNPEGRLTVEGHTFIRSGGMLFLRPADNTYDFNLQSIGSGGGARLAIGGNSMTTEAMSILTNGKVGIGTTNPLDKLSVAGSIGVGGAGFDNPGGVSGQGIAFPSTTNDAQRIYGEHNGGDISNLIIEQRDNTDDAVIFRQMDCCGAGTLDYMRIARDGMHYIGGNVGIGTAGPSKKLDVVGDLFVGSGALGRIYLGDQSAKNDWIENDDVGGGGFRIVTDNAERLRILPTSGNVGIGTTNPQKLLHLSSVNSPALRMDDTSAGGKTLTITQGGNLALIEGGGIYMDVNGDTTGDALVILPSGNVGIGTTNPGYTLEVNGQAHRIDNSGSWTVASDIRLKKNIKTIDNALGKMVKLHGVSFEWKEPEKHGNKTKAQMGMIAQEVENVFPQWVITQKDSYKDVNYNGFEALTVEAIKELKAENDRKNIEIQELKKRIAVLESKN